MRTALLVLASLSVIAGCSSSTTEEGASSSSDLTAIAPKDGLYTGTMVANDDTCGLRPGLDRSYVSSAAAAAYTTSYVIPQANVLSSFAVSLAGRSGTNQGTQTIDLGPGTSLIIDMKLVDTWQSSTTFVRRAEESYRCEGDGCAALVAAAVVGTSGQLPCSATKITAFSVASCDAYPFRQVYDDSVTSVWVTGTFNNWAKTPDEGALVMTKGADGAWTLDANLPLPTSADGTHLYKFIKNGAWYWDQDLANPMSVPDGQTGTNSILYCE